MSLPLSPTMAKLFLEVEKLKARRILREQMDSCMDKIFEKMKRKLMQLVQGGGIETDDEHGDPIDREQQLDTNDINPTTSTNSQNHQVNTRSPCTDDHFDDNNTQQNGQVNYATDNDTQQDRDEPDIKEELDDTDNQLELLPNQTQNPDIALTNATLTTSNEISNHYNLTGWDEENQLNLNPLQQINPSYHVVSFNEEVNVMTMMDRATQTNGQFEDWMKQEIKDVEVKVGDDLRDQVGHIPHDSDSRQIDSTSPSTDDHSINNTNTTLPNDQIQMSNQAIDDDHQQSNGQVSTDNDTQQDWDGPEIEGDEETGEDDNESSLENVIEPTQHVDSSEPEINEEFDGTTNQLELIPIPNQTHNRGTSLTQSNLTNLEDEINQVNHNTQQLGDETNNGEGVEIEEDNDDDTEIDSDNGDEIEDNRDEEDEASRSVVNSQMDTTPPPNGQSRVTRQSARIVKRKQTDHEQVQNEVDYHEDTEDDEDGEPEATSRPAKRTRSFSPATSSDTKQTQVITRTLQCPQCDLMLVKDKFIDHLMDEHSISRFSCPVKDCKQSFDNTYVLSQHNAQSHKSTTQWQCDKCDHYFPSYINLSAHTAKIHQLGLFQCSFPACTFTAECKSKVLTHYNRQHRQTMNKCQHPDCPYETVDSSHMKRHQRIHLGIKP